LNYPEERKTPWPSEPSGGEDNSFFGV